MSGEAKSSTGSKKSIAGAAHQWASSFSKSLRPLSVRIRASAFSGASTRLAAAMVAAASPAILARESSIVLSPRVVPTLGAAACSRVAPGVETVHPRFDSTGPGPAYRGGGMEDPRGVRRLERADCLWPAVICVAAIGEVLIVEVPPVAGTA